MASGLKNIFTLKSEGFVWVILKLNVIYNNWPLTPLFPAGSSRVLPSQLNACCDHILLKSGNFPLSIYIFGFIPREDLHRSRYCSWRLYIFCLPRTVISYYKGYISNPVYLICLTQFIVLRQKLSCIIYRKYALAVVLYRKNYKTYKKELLRSVPKNNASIRTPKLEIFNINLYFQE